MGGSLVSTTNAGFGLIGAGAAIAGASFIPESSGVLPAGIGGGAMMFTGAGVAGIGTALAIMGGGGAD